MPTQTQKNDLSRELTASKDREQRRHCSACNPQPHPAPVVTDLLFQPMTGQKQRKEPGGDDDAEPLIDAAWQKIGDRLEKIAPRTKARRNAL
ncbi:hypothetical protein [Rhizobium sp. BK377]|uniref:hypothetical protein n=1 Tax=Rhizobium sp. BK377 TaxID=2587058 RepID=UPI0016203680|nr:hypothetical protein [Rhizobium sp. BK377]MBB3463144.1 hypothetical protein [Rhizobium sp. BK377]